MQDFAAGRQSIGGRSYQEDAFNLIGLESGGQNLIIGILADGMGGHAAGDVAANLVVETVGKVLLDAKDEPYGAFLSALDEANRAIRAEVEIRPERAGMGCTLVVALLSAQGLRWISVGDSLLLHVSRSGIRRLNADHSMAPRLDAAASRGEITREQALNSPSRNALLSAVSGDEISRVDVAKAWFDTAPDDKIIIASDGLDTLNFDEIALVISDNPAASPADLAGKLIEAALSKKRPNQDNITVIVLEGKFREVPQCRNPAHLLTMTR